MYACGPQARARAGRDVAPPPNPSNPLSRERAEQIWTIARPRHRGRRQHASPQEAKKRVADSVQRPARPRNGTNGQCLHTLTAADLNWRPQVAQSRSADQYRHAQSPHPLLTGHPCERISAAVSFHVKLPPISPALAVASQVYSLASDTNARGYRASLSKLLQRAGEYTRRPHEVPVLVCAAHPLFCFT